MNKLIFFILLAVIFSSCDDKQQIIKGEINTDFDKVILKDYFVTSIAFDNVGNAWIGTFKQGLIKYHSGVKTVYNASNSIISDEWVINNLEVDSKNNVWVGAEGLIKFDGKKFTHYNTSNTPIPEDFVSSIAIDSRDNVWFTSCRFRKGGVVKYDGTNWKVFTPENSPLPKNLVKSIAIDKNDDVWLALNEIVNDVNLAKISNNNKWTVYTNSELGFTPYYLGNIKTNSKNQLCAAIDYSLSSTMNNNRVQTFIFDGKTATQLNFENSSGVKSLYVDRNDNIWCCIYRGIAVYNGEKWILNNDEKFSEHGAFTIAQAPDNKIWIGTGNGIYINK